MLSTVIARRYFLSKRSQRVINIISWISVVSITIGTAALIIVLSVFNGFEDLITRLYNSFDPDIKVTAAHGKAFERAWIPFEQLKKIDGVKGITEVVEENGLIKYRDKQTLATIKGVSTDFEKNTGLDSMMADGKFILSTKFSKKGNRKRN